MWTLRVAQVLCAVVAAVAGGWCAREFNRLHDSRWVEVPLAAWTIEAEQASLDVRDGLPRRRLHWDGSPPRACVRDAAGRLVAIDVWRPESLSLNRSGVLWTRDGCRIALPSAEVAAGLVLCCELVPDRTTCGLAAGLTILAGLLVVGCGQTVRLLQTSGPISPALAGELRLTAFVFLSLATGLAFFPGAPVAPASSDAVNINSFAAALESPEIFRDDPVLGDPRNFAWYTPVYVTFVRWFGRAGLHFDTSRTVLAVVTTFLALVGYERLFRRLSGSALFGAAAAVALWFMKADYPPNEIWSVVHILPRTVFAAGLPWVLLALVSCWRSPRWWPAVGAASAVLFYIHPVSSPALTGAVLLGLLCGGRGRWLSRGVWACLGGLAAVAVMWPYVLIYSGKYASTLDADPAVMQRAFELARERFAPGFLDPALFVRQLLTLLVTSPRLWLGLAAAILLLRHVHRRSVRLWLGAVAGFGVVTFLIPLLDLLAARAAGRLPFQVDLVRNLRYVDVLLFCTAALVIRRVRVSRAAFLGKLAALTGNWTGTRDAYPTRVAVALLVLCYAIPVAQTGRRLAELAQMNVALLAGKPSAELAAEWELARGVEWLRAEGALVSGPLYLRTLRIPLAVSFKDLGVLAYSNPRQLVAAREALDAVEPDLDWPVTDRALRTAGARLTADWIVIERPDASPTLTRSAAVLFQNSHYLLCRVPRDNQSPQEPLSPHASLPQKDLRR